MFGSRKKILTYLPILFPLSFVGFSIYAYFYLSPEVLVNIVGVNNAYGLLFILAFLGGLTTFSGVPYHLILVTFAVGGLNSFLLGLSASVGVMLGDSTSYYLGYVGGKLVPERFKKIFHQVYTYSKHHPSVLPLFCFFYGALIPFSNDFITISAGVARYPFWRVMIPLAFGNLVFNVSLAFLSVYVYAFLQGVIF